jgi:hypothetical protein
MHLYNPSSAGEGKQPRTPHNLTMKKLTKYTLSAILGIGISYNANALQFILHDEFSGGQQPTGSIQVDINTVATNTVQLTISSQLVGTEFLSDLYLNLNPAYSASNLNFGSPTRTGSFGTDPVVPAPPPLNADGGGTFDIKFAFDTAPPADRFDGLLDSITYQITGLGLITNLVEADFDYLSQDPSGGHGFFKAAAHIQGVGTNGDGSGFIAPNGVPDGGTTVMLLGTALACLGALRQRLA